MGGSLQRIEVLLIGLALLIAGAVVALLTVVRPLVPPGDVQAAPPTVVPLSAPTAVPSTPIAPVAATPPILATPSGRLDGASLPALPRLLWPLLLLVTGCLGLPLAVLRARRRRMPYTNQSMAQLLATADATTRATNVRVMRDLAEQGVLTADLAAAAGIDLRQPTRRRWVVQLPRVRWPQIAFPVVRLPRLRIPALALPRWPWLHYPALAWQRWRVMKRRLVSHTPAEASPSLLPIVPEADGIEQAIGSDSSLGTVDQPSGMVSELTATSAGMPIAVLWTAEDRALAVANVFAELWGELGLRSTIMAFDTPPSPGAGSVLVTIDPHPDEEKQIADLPTLLTARRPAWRVLWQRNLLEVTLMVDGAPPVGGPLLAPVLTHGRGGVLTRFLPLASWPHLGIYGSAALGALHTILGSLLYAQSPSDIALAIIDHGEIGPLYRDVAHLAPLPDTPHATIELLTQAIRRVVWSELCRLILAVVEPDDAQLNLLVGLLARLQARPGAPMHLIVVQERPRNAGQELYGLLPALITAGGQRQAALVPGQRDWPKPGAARLIARGMRMDGRPIVLDESAIATLLVQLRGAALGRAPLPWDAPDPGMGQRTSGMSIEAEMPADVGGSNPHEDASTISNVDIVEAEEAHANHTRRIAAAITQRRQLLMIEEVATGAAAPVAASTDERVDDGAISPPIAMLHADRAPMDGVSSSDVSLVDANMPITFDDPVRSRRAGLLHTTLEAGATNAPPVLAWMQPLSSAATDAPLLDRPHPPQPIEEPDNGWPVGPAPLGRAALAELMARVVSAPAIVAGPTNELGVTKNRLADLLKGTHKAQAKDLAEVLLVWFDQAGLLVEPTKPGRLRHPRALVTTDLPQIAAKLTVTACPDQRTVAALWAESNEGRS